MNAIPIVDLAQFTQGSIDEKLKFVADLGKAYEEVGFVAVKNHGIPDDLIAELYQCVTQFYALPTAQKATYEIVDLAGQRGYTSFGREHAKGYDAPDLKEFFQYGQEVTDDQELAKDYPANVVVTEIPNFKISLPKF